MVEGVLAEPLREEGEAVESRFDATLPTVSSVEGTECPHHARLWGTHQAWGTKEARLAAEATEEHQNEAFQARQRVQAVSRDWWE